ncbi:zinc finger SWIM domain-containing protein 7-like [Plutella xylostella]|uniref:zinc finger SWIM domain-containing protein 7-like n=1 Tax=Plutella xylostella TaxID=51655 RepID=UPI002032D01F|nr:zinc finger SWIM domain-containing protein 7-like [Plutella xylostella]
MSCNTSEIPTIALSILNRVEARINKSDIKQITDEELLSLYSVFGAALQRALDILEKNPTLTIYATSNNKRELIEIKGDNDRCYRVFPRINFCPCRAFRHQVIERKVQVTCKHIIAARLALILNRTALHEVTSDQYLMLLKSMFDLEDS